MRAMTKKKIKNVSMERKVVAQRRYTSNEDYFIASYWHRSTPLFTIPFSIAVGLVLLFLGYLMVKVWLTGSIAPLYFLKYLLFILAAYIIPGMYLVFKFSGSYEIGESIVLSAVFGYFGGMAAFYVLGMVDARAVYLLIVLTLDVLAVRAYFKKKLSLPALPVTLNGLLFGLLFLWIIHAMGIHSYMNWTEDVCSLMNPDHWNFIPYAAELIRHIPPENPFGGGIYIDHVLHMSALAMSKMWLGIPLFTSQSLVNGLVLILTILTTYYLGKRMFSSGWAGLLSVLTVFFTLDAGLLVAKLDQWLTKGTLFEVIGLRSIVETFYSLSSAYVGLHNQGAFNGMLAMFSALLFLMRYLERGKLANGIFYAIILAAALKIKNPFIYAFLAATGLTTLISFYFYRGVRMLYAFILSCLFAGPFLLHMFGYFGGVGTQTIVWMPLYYVHSIYVACVYHAFPAAAKFIFPGGPKGHLYLFALISLFAAVWPHLLGFFTLKKLFRTASSVQKQIYWIILFIFFIGYYIFEFYVEPAHISAASCMWFPMVASIMFCFFLAAFLWKLIDFVLTGAVGLKKILACLLLVYFVVTYMWSFQGFGVYGKIYRIGHDPKIVKACKFIREKTNFNSKVLVDIDENTMATLSLNERCYPNRLVSPGLTIQEPGALLWRNGKTTKSLDAAEADRTIDYFSIEYIYKRKSTPLSLSGTTRYDFVPVYDDGQYLEIYEIVSKGKRGHLPRIDPIPLPTPVPTARPAL